MCLTNWSYEFSFVRKIIQSAQLKYLVCTKIRDTNSDEIHCASHSVFRPKICHLTFVPIIRSFTGTKTNCWFTLMINKFHLFIVNGMSRKFRLCNLTIKINARLNTRRDKENSTSQTNFCKRDPFILLINYILSDDLTAKSFVPKLVSLYVAWLTLNKWKLDRCWIPEIKVHATMTIPCLNLYTLKSALKMAVFPVRPLNTFWLEFSMAPWH